MEAWKEELYHHGILGMRWGKRNGPPYPLSPSRHSASEKKAGWRKSLSSKIQEHKKKRKKVKAAAKARAAKQQKAKDLENRQKNMRNPKWLRKHMGELSNEELKSAKDRLTLENDLRQQSIRKINTGKDYADMILGYADTGINTYNKIAKIYNATENGQKDPLVIIGEGNGKKKKKK